MRRFMVFILPACVLALGAVYAVQEAELRAARKALAQASQSLDAGALPGIGPGMVAPALATVPEPASRTRPRYGVSPAVQATGTRPRPSDQQVALLQRVRQLGKRLADNPAFQRVARATAESQVDKNYASLFQKLDPATAAALAALLKEQAGLSVDAALQLNAGGLKSEERRRIWSEAAEAARAIDAQIADLLGAEGYAEYQEYVQTLAERQQVEVFKEKLFSAGLGLAPSQEEALVALMHAARHAALTPEENPTVYDHSIHLPEERKLKPEEMELERMEVFHDRFLEGAQDFLMPEQIAVFEEHLADWEEYWEAMGEYLPSPDVESNDRAEVEVKGESSSANPVTVNAADTELNQWGDMPGGSSSQVYKTEGNMLGARFEPGSGWGAGLTFWPSAAVVNEDGSVGAAGASRLVVRLKAPAGINVRFGLLESGAEWSGASRFAGVNGADGEAFRHPGLTTADGWQVYSIPLSELRLNGGYGNQGGNRVVDVQAIKGIEILVPGGQPATDMEIEYLRLE